MQLQLKQRIDNLIGGALVALHVVPVRLAGKLLRIDHSLKKDPDNIIVIKMLGLGSLVLSGDALLALKKKYPQAKLILIGGNALKGNADIMGLFDSVWIIDDSSFLKMLTSAFNIVFKCLRLRNKWCFDFEVYSRLTTIFSLYTFSTNRFGFEFEKVNFRNYLNTHNTYFNQFIPSEENYNHMAESAGAVVDERYYLPATTSNRKPEYIVINNTCSDLSIQRKLEPEQLTGTIKLLLTNTQYKIALAGAPADKAANEKILKILNDASPRVENWAGVFSFNEYTNKLAGHTAALLTIDSAPLHIAARLKVPLLAVWGPTQPQSLAPNWLRSSPLYREINLAVHCSPCVHQTKELPCKGNNFCIKDIAPLQISNALNELING